MPVHWDDRNSAGGYGRGLLAQNNLDNLLRSRRATVIPDDVRSNARISMFDSTAGMPAVVGAMGSYTGRNAAPTREPLRPVTIRREGRTVSDIFKDAQLGQFGARVGRPAAPSPLTASGQFGPHRSSTPWAYTQDPLIEGTLPEQDAGDLGPQGFMSKIGGFLNKPGVIGQSAMAAGARMMQGSPDGTFATIGHGLEAGLDTYGELKKQRLLDEDADRIRTQEDEDRASKEEVNDKIQAMFNGWDANTPDKQKVSDSTAAAAVAFGNGDDALGGRLIELARVFRDREGGGGSTTKITNYSKDTYRAPNGTPAPGRRVDFTHEDGTVTQLNEFYDEKLYEEKLNGGMGEAEAQMAAWRPGGEVVDPNAEKVERDKAATTSSQDRMNNRLMGVAVNAHKGMLAGDLDYWMAGAVATSRDKEGKILEWKQGGPGHLQTWQSLWGEWINNHGGDKVGGPARLLNMIGRSKLPPETLRGYTEALNFINPVVRYLSGAQMTNQEAMRYYNALIPMPGDHPDIIELKRRKREVLVNAMGGDRGALGTLGFGPDDNISHALGDFASDDSGQTAMDYYLDALDSTLGETDTFTQAQLKQIASGAGGVPWEEHTSVPISTLPPTGAPKRMGTSSLLYEIQADAAAWPRATSGGG